MKPNISQVELVKLFFPFVELSEDKKMLTKHFKVEFVQAFFNLGFYIGIELILQLKKANLSKVEFQRNSETSNLKYFCISGNSE